MKKGLRKLVAMTSIVATLGAMTGGGLVACGNDDAGTNDEGNYTYNAIFSATPTTWSSHTWETNDDSVILGFTTMGLYDVQLNKDKTSYEWVPEMAAGDPVDVTSQYAGQYGIKTGDQRKVWEIPLNRAATWDDGTPITADDYVYSMKQLLDPDMLNRRSDSYTGGGFTIYGAKNYLYGHTPIIYESVASHGYASNAEAVAAGETLYIDMINFYGAEGAPAVAEWNIEYGEPVPDPDNPDATPTRPVLNCSLTMDYDKVVTDQWTAYTDTTMYFDLGYFAQKAPEYMNADGTINTSKVAQDKLDFSDYLFSAKMLYDAYGSKDLDVGGGAEQFIAIKVENANLDYSFDNVGIKKKDDYTIVLAVTDEQDDFYIKYYLSSNWIVKQDVYERCKVTTGNLVSSTYCTSAATTPSYGPYKLVSFTRDSEFKLVTNPNWYGYTDGNHEGQFQTTCIKYRYVSPQTAHSTTKELFFRGEVDELSLSGAAEYQTFGTSSSYNVYPDSYTMQFFMSTNSSYLEKESSATENHRPLQLASFRKAISYSLDRKAYCDAWEPASQPGFGLLNYMYSIDGNTGELYREQSAAKKASLRYAGFTEGEDGKWSSYNGTKFDTLDEAYDAITGYDPDYAASLFQQAYNEAKAQGLYKDGEPVVLELRSSGQTASEMFNGTAEMFNKNIADAIKKCPAGTTFSSVTLKVGTSTSQAEYSAAVKKGEMDISFSGWGGATFNPWGVIYGSYIDPANSNNFGFDTMSKGIDITVKKGNEDITESLYNWARWLDNHQDDSDYDGGAAHNLYKKLGRVGESDMDFRVAVLAECELAQLNTAVNIPLFYQSTGSLNSAKYNNGCDQYLPLIGFGGIRHFEYNYTNSEWSNWVRQQGGNLEDYYKTN